MKWNAYVKALSWAVEFDYKGGHACPHCNNWTNDEYPMNSIIVWCRKCRRHFKVKRGLEA